MKIRTLVAAVAVVGMITVGTGFAASRSTGCCDNTKNTACAAISDQQTGKAGQEVPKAVFDQFEWTRSHAGY